MACLMAWLDYQRVFYIVETYQQRSWTDQTWEFNLCKRDQKQSPKFNQFEIWKNKNWKNLALFGHVDGQVRSNLWSNLWSPDLPNWVNLAETDHDSWSPKVDNLIPGCQKKNRCTVHLKKHHQFEIFFPQQSQTALTQKFFLSLVVFHVFQCFDMWFPFVSRWFPRKVVQVSGGHVRHASAAGATGHPYHAHQHALGEAYRQDRSLAEKWKAGDWVVETWGTGWWLQTFFIFHFIYGMSSFPLTFTPSFFKMGTLHHQPGKNNRNKNSQALFCLGFIRFPVPEVPYRYDWWRKLQDFPIWASPDGPTFQISIFVQFHL